MKEIKLSPNGSKHKGLYVALVDDDGFELINKFRWNALVHKNLRYCYSMITKPDGTNKLTLMHRFVMGVTDPKVFIDGDGLDNRKRNLRICTHRENLLNGRNVNAYGGKPTASTFKGVHVSGNRWRAQVTVHHKKIHLGYFDKETDAARAYNEFAKKNYGEFARLNEVD